jgi:hypothetical protein
VNFLFSRSIDATAFWPGRNLLTIS